MENEQPDRLCITVEDETFVGITGPYIDRKRATFSAGVWPSVIIKTNGWINSMI